MNSVMELYRRDPLTLTRDDLTEIVQFLRANRGSMNNAAAKPKASRSKAAAKPKITVEGLDDLLSDLIKD